MSLFLIYVETGKPIPFEPPREPLSWTPTRIRNQRGSGKVREGIAITDGVAADHFLRYDKREAGRRGEALRKELFRFVADRVARSARAVLTFQVIHGNLHEVTVALDDAKEVNLTALPSALARLTLGDVIAVVADGACDGHGTCR